MSTKISVHRKKYRCIEKNIGASKKISVHWENIVVHWENIVVHWENIVVHWENIVVHWEILLCTEKYCCALRKYCCVLRNVFVHWENIVVYCNIFTCMHKYCCVLHIWATVHISSQQSIIPPYSLQSETAMHISHSVRQNREIIVQVVIKASALAQW
jgi:hypothetical protein